MRKYLLPMDGNLYRANLHCHTNISDGELSPEQMKAEYRAHGYSVIAYTDHRVMLPHHELTDSDFLALSGVEYDVMAAQKTNGYRKCCHICMIALDPDNNKQPCYNSNLKFHHPELHAVVNPNGDLPEFDATFENASAIMQKGREEGFFVTYNHPTWSMEDYSDYMNYHGMHAMEMSNYGCIVMGYPDYNPRVYDDMLRGGERIFAIGTDDNHNHHPKDTNHWDSFGGYTMIKAERLDYKTITDALVAGSFYAVDGDGGADIEELWYEDGKLHIKCTAARDISVITGIRRCFSATVAPGCTVTEADFDIPEDCIYFRVTVTDTEGRHTNTNAYFLDDLTD